MKKPKPIYLTDTEKHFLSMVLNDVIFSWNTIEGKGYRPFAYYMIRKIEGRSIDIDMRKAYEKFVHDKIKRQFTKIFGKVK